MKLLSVGVGFRADMRAGPPPSGNAASVGELTHITVKTARASHRRGAAPRKFRHKLQNGLFEFNYSHIFTTTVSFDRRSLSVRVFVLIH
jgi:hypothetical protein